MNKMYRRLLCLLGCGILASCGDDSSSVESIENRNIGNVDIVEKIDDLPDCTDQNNGVQFFVKEDSRKRICVDEAWYVSISEPVSAKIDCRTEKLEKETGFKVVCNGDSIGVVKNGKDGADGEDGESGANGESCRVDVDGSIVSIICSGDTLKYVMDKESEVDVISQLDLSGYSQKGPFVKGSKVFAYELNNSRDLEQTSRSYISTIQSDDGAFVIPGVSLISPYVLLEASGFYLREETGNVSVAPISLFALTDLMERETANINLLTHIQYYRIKNLVLDADLSVSQARDSAKKEILKTFHIELEKISDLEDLNIFEKGDDNAALLAISIMLQRDSSDAALTELLSEISVDVSEYGAWKDSLKRAEVALWSALADMSNRFPAFRNNIAGWKGVKDVPDFEKYIRSFWAEELGFGKCGSDVPNAAAKNIFENQPEKVVATYLRYFKEDDRFVCDASVEGNPRWRFATDIEKDTMGWGRNFDEGSVKMGQVYSDRIYVFDEGVWRLGTERDTSFAEGYHACVKSRLKEIALATDGEYYKCEDSLTGDAIRSWIPVSNYEVDTSLAVKKCTSENANDTLVGLVDPSVIYMCEDGTWLKTTSEYDYTKGMGVCVLARNGECARGNDDELYVCHFDTITGRWMSEPEKEGWLLLKESSVWSGLPKEVYFNLDIEYDTIIDSRDKRVYRIVTIGEQTWMAENLHFTDFKTYYEMFWAIDWWYDEAPGGIYYSWAAAMDSIGQFSQNSYGCGDYTTCEINTPARGICPENWHIPTIEEWHTLVETVEALGGGKTALLSKGGWGENMTDEFGFSAVETGLHGYGTPGAIFWSATEESEESVSVFHLAWAGPSFGNQGKHFSINGAMGLTVRCVKDPDPIESGDDD